MCLLLVVMGAGLLAARTVSETNKHGEKVKITYANGKIVRREIFLKKKRRIRLQIPAVPKYELVLHFPDGKTIQELYSSRVRKKRVKEFKTGLRVTDVFAGNGKTRIKRIINYPKGQVQTVSYYRNGKKRLSQVEYPSGQKKTTAYDRAGRPLRLKNSIPGGDTLVRTYKAGRPVRETVDMADGGKRIRSFKQGLLAREKTIRKGKPDMTRYFGSQGKKCIAQEYTLDSARVRFEPDYKQTTNVIVEAPQKTLVRLAFREDYIYEEHLFDRAGWQLTVSCIPAETTTCLHRSEEKTVSRKHYIKGTLRQVYRAEYSGGKRRHALWKKYDAYSKLIYEKEIRPSGEILETRVEDGVRRTVLKEKGRVRERRMVTPDGEKVVNKYNSQGKLIRKEQIDQDAFLFKIIKTFQKGKLRFKEEYYKDGRKVRSRYDASGKRTGLWWSRWKDGDNGSGEDE